MIGIVVVSHSAKLADGVVQLAQGMVGIGVKLAAAGGLDTLDDTLGTDALRVLSAIEEVYDNDGVLILMDLGSAILSAETALDLLAPETRSHVKLCAAPLVEGTVAAAVQAMLGASLDQVIRAAHEALAGKQEQLGEVPPRYEPIIAPPQTGDLVHWLMLTVPNRLGLHARPAAHLVELTSHFSADISLRDLSNGRGPASARSLNGLLLLDAVGGHQLEITATGMDAENALAALQAFADQNFGDPPDIPQPAPLAPVSTASISVLRGQPASPGIAIGSAKLFRVTLPPISTQRAEDSDLEWKLLLDALDRTSAQIVAQSAHADSTAAEIFNAHRLLLSDPALRDSVHQFIMEQHLNAAAAWKQATDDLIAQYRQLDSGYLQARAADVEGLQMQVLAHLLGAALTQPGLSKPAILIARNLTPADTAALDAHLVLGIATTAGSATSHSAILARSLGIPAVVGLGESLLAISDGTPLILNGTSGEVLVEPDEITHATYAAQVAAAQKIAQGAHERSAKLAYTANGQRIEIFANIGAVVDVQRALEFGAEGVGLLRTEFIFLSRATAPDEDEQYQAYRTIAQALGGRPLVIRTLDVGGDKPLSYVDQPHEDNPFLGLRGIRLCLARPDFFKVQLRALARLALDYSIRVMFPMVATLDEFRAAKALVLEAQAEIHAPVAVPTGIMVEVPAVVQVIEHFSREVDFFSIGTNDLTQYTFAAERGNLAVASLSNALHPAILRMIGHVVEVAHAIDRPVAICGELASDPLAVPILIGLGVDELSMNPPAIPAIKGRVRSLQTEAARTLARQALELETAEQVRRLVREA